MEIDGEDDRIELGKSRVEAGETAEVGDPFPFPGEWFLDGGHAAADVVHVVEQTPPVLRLQRVVEILRSLFVDLDVKVRLGRALDERPDEADARGRL